MKAEHIIAHYLIFHGSISLQELGTFTYTGSTQNIEDLNRNISFPENSINFEYNPKAQTDEAFIEFAAKHIGKLRSLVASDFESHLLIGKQFLNIGKPFAIADIGVLIKQQNGVFEFSQGAQKHESIDTNHPGDKYQTNHQNQVTTIEKEISFSLPTTIRKQRYQNKWLIGGVIILLILAGVITGIQNYKKNQHTDLQNNIELQENDSIITTPDSVQAIQPTTKADTIGFDFILNKIPKDKEKNTWLKKWEKYHLPLLVDSTDSAFNFIYIHYELPHRDTSVMKDSLALRKLSVSEIRLN